MAAALRFAAKRIFGRAAIDRPPQAFIAAVKEELAPRIGAHSGRSLCWPFSFSSSSLSPATLLTTTTKAAAAGPSSSWHELRKAATGSAVSALSGLAVGSLVTLPLYVSIVRRAAQRRAAEREHKDWLKHNEIYTL